MKYPNRLIKRGEQDKAIVKAVQKQLNKINCGPLVEDGDFGRKTLASVKLFQSRHADINGQPLVADGILGAISWQVLFKNNTVPSSETASNDLLKKVLEVAQKELGVRENPLNSNRGPEVDLYLRRAGLDAHRGNYAWCMAFVYWCFDEASKAINKPNPAVKTAGVLNQWNKTIYKKIKTKDAVANPALIKPGFIFIRNYGGGLGHTGIVTAVNGGYISTIEGNSNDNGSRDGVGVFALTRKINSIENGFIDFKTKA